MRRGREEQALLRRWNSVRRDYMHTPEDVAVMVRLHELGWGLRRIARELGVGRNTVRRYVRHGGWRPYELENRPRTLAEVQPWVEEQFRKHRGNAEVVRQELERVHDIKVSLRTVERAVAGLRREMEAEALAAVRFETPPGHQLQVDFGQVRVNIGGEAVTVHLCVMTLGYSRRIYVQAHARERQRNWLASLEAAFLWFGGVPNQLLVDNPRALVSRHDPRTREVEFNGTFAAFCRHWKTTPRACAPYRARTKGKDERAVGYVKRNAIAGREFDSWEALQAWLDHWCRDIADVRKHGTTGDRPIDRFDEREAQALRPIHRASFQRPREVTRKVGTDLCVEVDTNRYSVPFRLIGCRVSVLFEGDHVRIRHGGHLVATHAAQRGRRRRSVDPEHLAGVVVGRPTRVQAAAATPEVPPSRGELMRPLSVYEDAAGGAW